MREKLEEIKDVRGTFIGTFVREGTKRGYKGDLPTILLKDITDIEGNFITDHLWFNYTKGFANLGKLNEGDKIQFNARSKVYEKGYKGRRDDVYYPIEQDYKLSHPSKIKRV